MVSKKKKTVERPVFESIRKPVAPPTTQMENRAREMKRLPTMRKAKHKKDASEQID
jgi:hypothetical protein